MLWFFSSAGKEVSARSPGTTVSLQDLFKTLPVRHKAFQKNLKKEYVRLVHILQAYATASTGVRFIATNQVSLHTPQRTAKEHTFGDVNVVDSPGKESSTCNSRFHTDAAKNA